AGHLGRLRAARPRALGAAAPRPGRVGGALRAHGPAGGRAAPRRAECLGGGRARARGELLSFLFFDEAIAEALIEAGRDAAQAWLVRHPALWSDANDELSEVDARAARGLAEQATLDEYRAWRPR